MKAFIFEVERHQAVKVLMGFGAIAFAIRVILGVTNEATMFGVTVGGYEQFIYVVLAASAVLLLWDIRDTLVGRS